jgi:hypothetical protein
MRRLLLIGLLIFGGCGGGGGGSAPSRSTPSTALPEVVTFLEPASFVNGGQYETGLGIVSFLGEFRSEFTLTLDCADPSNFTPEPYRDLRWRNLANDTEGTAVTTIGCYESDTIFGVGVRTRWWTYYISLELGANVIQFDLIENGEVIGRNRVTVWRTDTKPPTVTFVHPAADSIAVAVNHPVLVLFDKAMLETSLDASDFIVRAPDGVEVQGTRAYDAAHHTWVFQPSVPFAPGSTYGVTLRSSVEDLYRTGGLATDLEWQFTTGSAGDTESPVVARRWPAATCACIPPSTRIMLEADEPLGPASITVSTLTVSDSLNNAVAGTTVYRGRVLEFVPDDPLLSDETYAVTASGFGDLAGNVALAPAGWQFTTDDGAMRGAWQELAALPKLLWGAVMASDGTNVYAWGNDGPPGESSGLRGYRYQSGTDQWQPIADLLRFGATEPEHRRSPTVVWDGTDFILFGGFDRFSEPRGDGGRYHPVSDSWEQLYASWWDSSRGSFPGLLGLADHSALWTGDRMLIWGGLYRNVGGAVPTNRGWTYDPVSDVWTITGPEPTVSEDYHLLPDPGAPLPRFSHAAVWSGTEMLLWGGIDAAGEPLADGGRYAPASDTWQPLSTLNAPAAASVSQAVWAGDAMLSWNGGQPEPTVLGANLMRRIYLRSYHPAGDVWQVSSSGWEPAFLAGTAFFMFWTGAELVTVGTEANEYQSPYFTTLAAYIFDPAQDTWRVGAKLTVPACRLAAATLHLGQVFLTCADQTYLFSP